MGVINGSGSGTCRDWEAARGFGRSRGELFDSQIHNQRKRRGPGSVLGSQALDPTPRPVPSLEERAAPTGPASPGRKLLVVGAERVSSPGGPSPGVTLGKPCLCIKIPGSSLSGCRVSVVTHLVTALFLPAPAVPSCPQLPAKGGCLVSQPPPSPKKPPAKGRLPLTAECMATAGTERIPEQPLGSQSGRKAGATGAGPLPASPCRLRCSAHTRDHVVITKDSSGLPARNVGPPPPPFHSQRARTRALAAGWSCLAPLPAPPQRPQTDW